MIRAILIVLALWCGIGTAQAQNSQCRTVPARTVSASCASEATVAQSLGVLPTGAFASLAACAAGTEGQTADVTDSTTNVFGATITGSGSFHVLAYCNGTNWTVAGGGASPSTPTAGPGIVINGGVISLDPALVGKIDWIAATRVPANYLIANGAAVSRTSFATLLSKLIYSSVVTITIASPAVISWASHGLSVCDPVKFYTSGALPTGITAGTPGTGGQIYFVASAGLTTNAFEISATCGGAVVNTSVSQSGTQTAVNTPWGDGDGSTTFNVPNMLGEFVRGWDNGRGVDANRGFGVDQLDAFQGHRHSASTNFVNNTIGTPTGQGGSGAQVQTTDVIRDPITDGTNGTPRTATETRPRNNTLLPVIRYQ